MAGNPSDPDLPRQGGAWSWTTLQVSLFTEQFARFFEVKCPNN